MRERKYSLQNASFQKKKAQSMVEFALVLPILLLLLFGILEYGRLFFAWISIENAARIGARYASTGEYNQSYCNATDITDVDGDGLFCVGEGKDEEINQARILSIKDETNGLFFGNPIIQAAVNSQAAYFNVTVCSASSGLVFTRPKMGAPTYSACTDFNGVIQEHPGDPGERVIISVDYNFPFIVSFFKETQNYFHLASYKEATVEQYRVSRVVNLPPTHTVPTIPTNTPTASITPSPTITASPTATPDCSLIYLNRVYVRDDDIRVEVRNDTGFNMPLTNSSLDWTKYQTFQYVDYFQWNWKNNPIYYKGNDSTAPTNNKACVESNCSFPTNKLMTWRGDFYPNDITLFGSYTVDLRFGDFCNVQAVLDLPTPVPSPTPDCDLISIQSVSTPSSRTDQVTISIENENPIDMPLTHSEITWTANSYVNLLRWSRNTANSSWFNYYGGDDDTSPNNRNCNNPKCSFPAHSSRDWFADFNPGGNPLIGTNINLTFGNICTVNANFIPPLSCDNMGIDNFYISGDDIRASVHNYNVENMPLISSNLVWTNYDPPYPNQKVDYTQWVGGGLTYNYSRSDDASSPTFRTCSGGGCDFPGGSKYNWRTDFKNANPLYGNYAADLVFSNGTLTCTLSDSIYQGTPIPPTPTPTPECANVSAGSLRRDGDDILMSVTNGNFASGYLTSSSLSWEPYGSSQYVDWVAFSASGRESDRFYSGDSTSSPTNLNSNVEIPGETTYSWRTDFDSPDAIYGDWALDLSIDFDNGLSCPLSGTLARATPVPQPTDIPSCDDISAGVPYISGDDVMMHVTNNNDIDIQITHTNFIWNNIDPSSGYVDEFKLGSRYYSGDDNNSPTSTSNTATLSANSGQVWDVDFDGGSAPPLYGDFTVELTFDVGGLSCPVSGSVSSSPPLQNCNDISVGALTATLGGDGLALPVDNGTTSTISLVNTHFVWDAQSPAQDVDWFSFNGSTYYNGNDSSSPTDSGSSVALASGGSTSWGADFTPDYDISGDFTVELTFKLNDGTTCDSVSRSGTISSGGGGFD